jgi:hypothetical protein
MALLASWPSITDDTTVYNKSFFDSIKASVEDNVHSTTGATESALKVKNVIDEVVSARGNLSSLDARLSGVIDDDGALITPSTALSKAQLSAAQGKTNWIKNGDFEIWDKGDTALPSPWTLAAGAVAVQQCGTGLTDTKKYSGKYCARLSNTGATVIYNHVIDTLEDELSSPWLRSSYGNKLSYGAWVFASETAHAQIGVVATGVGSSLATHTGGGSWEWLSGTLTIDASYTQIYAHVGMGKNSPIYLDSFWVGQAEYPPSRYQNQAWASFTRGLFWEGTPSAGDYQRYFVAPYMSQLIGVSCLARTAPSGGPITIGCMKYTNGATWQDVFDSSAININASGVSFNYYSTFKDADEAINMQGMMVESGTAWAGKLWRVDLDAVNSAADIFLSFHMRAPMTGIEMLRRVNNY